MPLLFLVDECPPCPNTHLESGLINEGGPCVCGPPLLCSGCREFMTRPRLFHSQSSGGGVALDGMVGVVRLFVLVHVSLLLQSSVVLGGTASKFMYSTRQKGED